MSPLSSVFGKNIRVHSNYGSLNKSKSTYEIPLDDEARLNSRKSRTSAGAEVEGDRLTRVDTLVNGGSKGVVVGGDRLTVLQCTIHCSRR